MIDRLIATLAARGETLAVAESLTGGLLAATIVSVPGVSKVFRGGLVTYATDLKHTLAGVDADLLAEHGPVHPEVARQMAAGARERCGATWGLSTTGVAGPGAQDGVPEGVVFVAIDGPQRKVEHLTLSGGRQTIRQAAVDAVLALLESSIVT
ncbi:CinA family protein [Catelliglobosispora koreensis]|uniref:CinA family protein n=1 Tax=Catelliglobosispora koreensis TaxID=129052 RepID=UPI0003A9CC7D|nr:CinA family protein [Catelliglobosispora koreensis]